MVLKHRFINTFFLITRHKTCSHFPQRFIDVSLVSHVYSRQKHISQMREERGKLNDMGKTISLSPPPAEVTSYSL